MGRLRECFRGRDVGGVVFFRFSGGTSIEDTRFAGEAVAEGECFKTLCEAVRGVGGGSEGGIGEGALFAGGRGEGVERHGG